MRFRRKLFILYGVFLVGLGVVWMRVLQLQTLEGTRWAEAAQSVRQRPENLQAPRGMIVDRTGVVLAEDERVFQLALSPEAWTHRARLRCTACGVVRFYDPGRRRPKRCACVRYQPAGEEGADASRSTYAELPLGDLRPLERALGVRYGTLAGAAAKRLAEIQSLLDELERGLRARHLDEFQIKDKVDRREEDLMRRPYVLFTGVDPVVVRMVHLDEEGAYRGFHIQTTLRRRYPFGDFAPQLLGFTSKVKDEAEYERLLAVSETQVTRDTPIGRTGLERAWHWQLAGTIGRRVMERDRHGFFTEVVSETPPRRGKTLQLSIDLEASRYAEERLEAHGPREGYYPGTRPSGGFVLLDAVTGRPLIWAETPRFDLNEDLGQVFGRVWNEAVVDKAQRRYVPRGVLPEGVDRAVWDQQLVMPAPLARSRVAGLAVEPGSTLKPLIALAALHAGRPLPFGQFRCGDLRKPGCHGCGVVGLERAIAKSCNQFFAALVRLGKGTFGLYSRTIPVFMDALGFGQRPGSEMREWEAGTWLRDWTDFRVSAAVADAVREVNEAHPTARLQVTMAPSRRLRSTVGGDRRLLTRVFHDLFLQIWRESGAQRIGVSAALEADRGSELDLRFDVRPLERGGLWHLPVTHSVAAFDELPSTLKRAGRRVPAMGGKLRFEGSFARRGKVWFTARFDAKVHRTRSDEPRRIRRDDGLNIGIGQGPVLATPLQMARAMAAIANGGRLVTPQVGWKLDGRVQPAPPAVDLGWEPRFVARVKAGMQDVVIDGTARNAGFGKVPARVYGKTGTAQVGAAWRPFSLPGEDADTWHHWFVGFAEGPGGNPVAFACVLHSRTEDAAGMTAAEAVADILAYWFAGGRTPAVERPK